jgi:hypothetical protein
VAGIEVALARGEWIDPALSRVTVGEWLAPWLAAQVQLKPTTRRRYEGIVTKQILPTWARVRLCDVTSAPSTSIPSSTCANSPASSMTRDVLASAAPVTG